MIKFESAGSLVVVENNNETIFEQINEISEGNNLFYGNTADSMGVHSMEITVGKQQCL